MRKRIMNYEKEDVQLRKVRYQKFEHKKFLENDT